MLKLYHSSLVWTVDYAHVVRNDRRSRARVKDQLVGSKGQVPDFKLKRFLAELFRSTSNYLCFTPFDALPFRIFDFPSIHLTSKYPRNRAISMLTATEVLTWRAPLKKAARLFLHSKEDAAGGKLNDKSDDWQYVSGQHWWCKVLFTQPSKKTWPVTMPDGQQGAGFPSATQPALHRQLRIIVESGSMESNDFPSASVQSWSTSYSQSPGGSGSIVASARSSSSHPWARMVLVSSHRSSPSD